MASITEEDIGFIITENKENSFGKFFSLAKHAVDFYYRGEVDILLQSKQRM